MLLDRAMRIATARRRTPTRNSARKPARLPTLYLRQWRLHRQLSQHELAGAAGLTQSMVSKMEQAQTDYTGATLAALSAALGCSVVELMSRDPTARAAG